MSLGLGFVGVLVRTQDPPLARSLLGGSIRLIRGAVRTGKKLAMLDLRVLFTLVVWNFQLLPLPGELGDLKGRDALTHRPQQVYLRLAEV